MVARFFLGLVLSVSVLTAFGACAPSVEPVIPEQSNAKVLPDRKAPITQVRQTLNLSAAETFQRTVNALQRRRVPINLAREAEGIVESGWINAKDSTCGGHRPVGAPLDCRARMMVKVEPLKPAASALHVRYEQYCSLNEEIPLVCPDSTGERLMLSVVEEVTGADGAQ